MRQEQHITLKFSPSAALPDVKLRPRPIRRPKVPTSGQLVPRRAGPVRGVEEHGVAPPIREGEAGIADGEEDDDARKRRARVEGRGEDVVVLGPPSEELSSKNRG